MTAAEQSLAAVRALSEGRAPKKFLRTAPLQDYKAPLARRPALEPLPVFAGRKTYGPIRPWLEKFRATQPGLFTGAQFHDWLLRRGYGNGRGAADAMVHNFLVQGLIEFDGTRATDRRKRLYKISAPSPESL